MADVLGVEAGQAVHAALERILFAHVPVGDELLAVGVGLDAEHDHVVEEAHGLLIGAADHLVDPFHDLLRADGLGGVQAAIDPDDGLALFGQRARLLLADAFGEGELARDLLVLRQIPDVLRRRDDGHPLVAAFLGLADALQLHARAFGGELLPVGFELGVVGDHVVVAQVEAEGFFRGGDAGGGLRVQQADGDSCRGEKRRDRSIRHIGESVSRFGP